MCEIKKIMVHPGKSHADDFLSVAVLLTLYPSATVLRLYLPTSEVSNAIVVDTGGLYSPPFFFDHHQSLDLPCSFILVLKYFFADLYDKVKDLPEIQHISDKDCRGPIYCQNKYGYRLPDFSIDLVSEVVLSLFEEQTVIPPNTALHHIIREIGKKTIEYLKKLAENLERAKGAQILEFHGFKLAIIYEQIPANIVKRVHDVDIIVTKNERDPKKYSVIRAKEDPRIDFRRVKNAYFKHSNGFLAVVDECNIFSAISQAITPSSP
ncbi:MAG: MYG1 family protein [Archaeoglobaceae archaeon]|nr:MYG1 family protein [Archaeoglobaceae archaeon]